MYATGMPLRQLRRQALSEVCHGVQKHEEDAAAHTDRDMYCDAMDAMADQLRYLDKFISSEDTVIDLKPFMRPAPGIRNIESWPLALPNPFKP